MAWTQADVDALEAEIKIAQRATRKGDRSVEMRSLDELLRLRAEMQASVATAAGTRIRQVRFITDKGLA